MLLCTLYNKGLNKQISEFGKKKEKRNKKQKFILKESRIISHQKGTYICHTKRVKFYLTMRIIIPIIPKCLLYYLTKMALIPFLSYQKGPYIYIYVIPKGGAKYVIPKGRVLFH